MTQAGLERGPEMFDWIEVGRAGRQKHQLTARSFHQLGRRRELMKPRVIQHDHTARQQDGQEHFFKGLAEV